MTITQKPRPVCTSIFKSGENKISKAEYTQKWIQLINTMEKNKTIGIKQ